MSTAATKKAIKSIKSLIEQQDHETAITEATSLLKQLNGAGQETEAAQVLCFRGLALTHVGRHEEAEKCYLTALKLKPSHPLATKALRRLYETQQSWDKLGGLLEATVQIEYDNGEAEACAAVLQELLELRSTHGPEESLYRVLGLLLPSSPLVTLLRTLTPPTSSYTPFPTPTYPPTSLEVPPSLPSPLPHALHLLSSLPLLMNLLIRSESRVHQHIEAKVKIGRQRIGGGTEKEVRKNVEAEVLGSELGMEMVDMLREVAGYPGVDDLVRREVEVREFGFWKKLMGVLSSENEKPSENSKPKTSAVSTKQKSSMISSKPPAIPAKTPVDESTPPLFRPIHHPRPTKQEAFSRAEGLAKGFVLLGVGGGSAEEAWSWVIEGLDEATLFYDLDLLHRFAMTFPESSLTDFIDDYCRWFRLPLPLPEEEEVAPVTSETAEEKPKKEKKQRWRRNQRGQNAKERRKARRMAGKEGTLAEDVDREERDELVASMTKLLDKLPKSIFAHRVVARISIEEEDWANAIAFAEKGRILVKELEADRGITLQNVKASLDTALGVALVPYFAPKHHPRATRLLNGVLQAFPDNFEARFARAQISQAAGKWQDARKSLELVLDANLSQKEMVATKEEVGWCLVNEGELEKGRDVLEGVVEIRDARWESEHKDDEAFARARAWYRLGRTEWMIGDDESKSHAEEWFMASIRALPSYAPAYSALGTCYSSASPPDEERALKCYQKAFELDATEAEAAHLLAIGYANDDEWAQVRIIAMRVMQGEGGVEGVAGGEVLNPKGRFAPKNGWAWKALGSTEVHYKNYAKAAQAYQIALRADPEDVSMWVMLGDSYVRCGRHTAGLKTLQHALELDPTSWLAIYHIGGIYSQLGSYDLAIENFENVAEMTKGEVGVVAALAQAMLDLGKQAASGGFRERSRRAFRNAIKLVGEVLAGKTGHRPWAWKVIGDAAFQLATQESTLEDMEDSFGIIRSVLELLVEDDSDRRSTIAALGHPSNLLQASPDLTFTRQASVFAFAYRVHLLKNEPRVINSALYDLATSLHALAQHMGPDNEDKRRECIKAAVSAVRGALERDAGDEKLWNALGVICADGGKQLAQHAFVVALELYTKDPIVWGNLGYLYLQLDDIELANACFLKAQTMDPDYAPAWLGQGLLADRNGDKDHAKALFAHAVTLSAGSLLEADLALAASTFMPFLVPGSKLDASILQQPAFALRHYVHQRPTDAIAAHLYALVCERIGLFDESVSSLERATSLFEAEFERSESTEIETQYSFALCNLGRVDLAAKQYDAALKAFTDLWGLISDTPPDNDSARSLKVQVKLGQALALFWLDKVDESLEAFQAALDECGDEKSKEEVAVILSRTLWGLGGDDAREVAKSHLLECLSHQSPSIKVITTLAAIATLTADDELVEATLSELSSLPLNRRLGEDTTDHTSLIMHLHALVDGQPADAEAILEASVHGDPANTVKRNRLARFLVAAGKTDLAIGVLEGMEHSGDSGLESERFRSAGLARVKGGDAEGLKELQKSVRARPWEIAGWEALVWAKNEVPVVQQVTEEQQVQGEEAQGEV